MKRIVAVDYGRVRCGIAISDSSLRVAIPLKIVPTKEFLREISNMIVVKNVQTIVFGIPMSLSGKELEIAKDIRKIAQELNSRYSVNVVFWDERFTTKIVRRFSGAKRNVDHFSAAIILQEYLDVISKGQLQER